MAIFNAKVLCFVVFLIIALTAAENVDDSPTNKVEDENTDLGSRNARYIRYQGNPYYYQNNGGYFYPNREYYPNRYPVVNQYPDGNTQFYPSDRYPNKLDPNYWLSKLPGFGHTGQNYPGYPTTHYPNYPSYPNYPNYPGGTNVVGYNPYPTRYPSGYPHTSYPQSGYPHTSYPQSGYPGYSGQTGQGNGGYGGYQGNGGLTSYSGYDGYYAAGNRPGNIGFGYQNSRPGIVGPRERYPNTLLPIATPSTVSKDAK